MPRPCRVCTHPDAAAINAALVRGVPSLRKIAVSHGLHPGATLRHKRNHLAAGIVREEQAIQRVSGQIVGHHGTITEELQALRAKADDLLGKAEADKDWKTALLAVREMRQLIESYERITTDRRAMAQDVAQSPSWRRLQSRLVEALRPVPGAIEALQSAIKAHLVNG